ncbi:MAG: hypothetical protein HQL28_00960 [Candidatus Omnitrophica bacterium]|nr:hypothetical protein [Candidatus Omnitrophota bacterium]
MKIRHHLISVCMPLVAACVLFLSSCGPTYPKEKLPETIKKVCKDEYKMDVDVSVDGSTLGIYCPIKGLLDVSMGISEEAWDQISNLILIASRVVLSTDAKINFYIVITQDERLPEMQIVIIKYVEDVKQGMFRYIGRDESFKRTLFSMNLTPQARKERSVEKVFDRLGVEEQVRESVLSEFFRSSPSKLSDIGYWRGHFYIKDVEVGEFLSAQIANRMRIDFKNDKTLDEEFKFDSAEGLFLREKNKKAFQIKYKIYNQIQTDDKKRLNNDKVKGILQIVYDVVDGYKFKEFDFVELEDQLENSKVNVPSDEIWSFKKRKKLLDDMMDTGLF